MPINKNFEKNTFNLKEGVEFVTDYAKDALSRLRSDVEGVKPQESDLQPALKVTSDKGAKNDDEKFSGLFNSGTVNLDKDALTQKIDEYLAGKSVGDLKKIARNKNTPAGIRAQELLDALEER